MSIRAFAGVADKYPQFKNKKVLLLQGKLHQDDVVATIGWGTEFLTRMGLTVADSINPFAVDQLRAFIPRDKINPVLGAAELLIWTTDDENDQTALLANPDVAALRERSVFTTKDQAGAIAFASPLSFPLVADQLPPLIAKILA